MSEGRNDGNRVRSTIAALAASQYGLVTRQQARERGLTDRRIKLRVDRGLWIPVQPGVFVIAGAPESWHRDLLAACLAAGPTAVVSHRSAAALWGFEGARRGPVAVTSSRWRRRPRGDVELHETQDLADVDRVRRHNIPVASPLRVVLDIGCLVSQTQLESMAVEGMRRGWFTYRDLVKRHRQVARRGRNGAGRLRAVLRELDNGNALAESGWEIRLSRAIVRMGLPRPVKQHTITDSNGNFVARVDLAYPKYRLAIEADSETWHTGSPRFHRDRTRWNHIRAAGWEVLVYTFEHYRHDRPHIARTLRAALASRAHLAAERPEIA
ncbi:MAG: type IV toxin-antitoxin system AbiEi family antitoxin domain-containing protein [Acidimicrobiia bacterium]|nr:type IV toxin-antitoxin system AbiEi family antitoxin domain-containing protein [Acidimicrobiia bacterium]